MAYELPNLNRLTLTEVFVKSLLIRTKQEETANPTQKAYTHRVSGKDKEGNYFCLRDYGPNTKNKHPYHYSNKDGSYGYSNPDGSKYHNDGQERSWYEPVPGVNWFRDGNDGRWTKQSVNGQPGMSSAGFEKIQAIVGQGSSSTRKYSQPEFDGRGIRRSEVNDTAHSDDNVTDGSSRSFSSQRRTYDKDHHVRERFGSGHEVKNDCTTDVTDYCSGGRDTGEYEEEGSGGYVVWSGNIISYGIPIGYRDTYNDRYNPGYDVCDDD